MVLHDLGTLNYRDAWALQEQAHEEVLAGGEERIFVVEHPPVITFGRRPGIEQNLLAGEKQLKKLGVEVVRSDRGGDITFHGPGQLVAYPIIRLADHGFSVGGYVHALEDALIDTLGDFDLLGKKEPSAVGVWTDDGGRSAKIGAIGVRIRRGATLHGLALNVATDLSFFDLIVPCGLTGRAVTSMQKILDARCPPVAAVKTALVRRLKERLNRSPVAASAGK